MYAWPVSNEGVPIGTNFSMLHGGVRDAWRKLHGISGGIRYHCCYLSIFNGGFTNCHVTTGFHHSTASMAKRDEFHRLSISFEGTGDQVLAKQKYDQGLQFPSPSTYYWGLLCE